jgi:putative glutamine amidotransferase
MGARLGTKAGSALPLIGVTTSEIRRKDAVRPTREGEPAQVELALGLEYVQAIEAAGAIPVVLPPLLPEVVAPLLLRLSGVCLSGGPDLDPAAYGGSPHPRLGPTEPAVDRFELEVARLAWQLGMPLLAICRGAQALNVCRGGTLVQHLPEVADVRLEHRQAVPARRVTHEVMVKPGTLLEDLLGRPTLHVNSFHHQAVKRLGRGLRVAARATDGVVEAVEAPGRPFVIGVQWHAECLSSRAEHGALFAGLAQAARGYARVRDAGEAA